MVGNQMNKGARPSTHDRTERRPVSLTIDAWAALDLEAERRSESPNGFLRRLLDIIAKPT
jgi:hypothetical protein